MGKRLKFLPTDGAEGRKITISSTDLVDIYSAIAAHFMAAIFDLDPGDYLITDESDLLDFTPMDESDTTEIWRRVEITYGVVSSDLNCGRLVKIFEAIASRQRVQ
jgi:hypothetical protein